MSKFYVVGKKYQRVVFDEMCDPDVELTDPEGFFTCTKVGPRGECWSVDSKYAGKKLDDGEGWIVSIATDLKDGYVVPV